MATPTNPGIHLRGGPTKEFFNENGNEIDEREIVIATETGEIGTAGGWFDPSKLSGGKVKNIYFAETPAVRQDIYTQTPTVITGLSLTITPETTKSSFIVVASVVSTYTHVASLLCFVNGSSLYSHANTNAPGAITTIYDGDNRTDVLESSTLQAKVDTNSLNPVTIDIRATSSWSTGIYQLYINDRSSNDMRGISTMVVYEVERSA